MFIVKCLVASFSLMENKCYRPPATLEMTGGKTSIMIINSKTLRYGNASTLVLQSTITTERSTAGSPGQHTPNHVQELRRHLVTFGNLRLDRLTRRTLQQVPPALASTTLRRKRISVRIEIVITLVATQI